MLSYSEAMNASAGCRSFELFDHQTNMTFPLVVMYPSGGTERPEQLGPFTIDVSMNAPIVPAMFPFVVISHGTGGSHLVYRNLAAHLARNGFTAAMPEHPGTPTRPPT